MTITPLEQHLRIAEQHLAQCQRQVIQQRLLIEKLERNGHDTELPKRVLAEYEHKLRLSQNDLRVVQEAIKAQNSKVSGAAD